MLTERTVKLMITAQNATKDALNSVKNDMGNVAKAATDMGEKTEKGFMQGLRGIMSFVRQIRGIYFIIAGLAVGMVAKLAQPINEYEKSLLKMKDTANLTMGDISQLAEVFEKQGEAIGLGTLALIKSTGDVSKANEAYGSIMASLKSLYEKLLPPMEKQDEVLRRLGLNLNDLYEAQKGPIEQWEIFHNKTIDARDAYILFGEKWKEFLDLIKGGKGPLLGQAEAMAEAARKTEEAKGRMEDYNQAIKDFKDAWLGVKENLFPFFVKLGEFLTTIATYGFTAIPRAIKEISDFVKGGAAKVPATAPTAAAAITVPGALPPEFASPLYGLDVTKTILGELKDSQGKTLSTLTEYGVAVQTGLKEYSLVVANSLEKLGELVIEAKKGFSEAKSDASKEMDRISGKAQMGLK